MDEMIAFCGSACQQCDAFAATRDDDDQKRAQVAQLWSKQYHAQIKAEDINCQGCKSTGDIHFNYCHVCEIRKCAMEKDVQNCARCDDYSCEKLDKFFEIAPENKERLDAIRG